MKLGRAQPHRLDTAYVESCVCRGNRTRAPVVFLVVMDTQTRSNLEHASLQRTLFNVTFS